MAAMDNPCHPGAVLREYLGDVSISTAARHLSMTRAALSRIVNGKAGISADMAVKLSILLGTSPQLWLTMQTNYDLWQAGQKSHDEVVPISELLPA